jgi:glutathionyl-hydroquinone reductase
VNNESSEIIRIFNSAFDDFLDEEHKKRDFYPLNLRDEIDGVNSWVYDLFNNGVYKVYPWRQELTRPDLLRNRKFVRKQLISTNVR